MFQEITLFARSALNRQHTNMRCLLVFTALCLCAILLSTNAQTESDSVDAFDNEMNLQPTPSPNAHLRRRRMRCPKKGRRFKSRLNHESRSERRRQPSANRTCLRAAKKTFPSRAAAEIKKFIRRIHCSRAPEFSIPTMQCESIIDISFNRMRLYITPWTTESNFSVVIPQGRLRSDSSHHAVAVLDPFPRAEFGHFVMIFYIDKLPRRVCQRKGTPMDGGFCLIIARRRRCASLPTCVVNFIPLVYDSSTPKNQAKTHLLECVDEIEGFGACPKKAVTPSPTSANGEHGQNLRGYNARQRVAKKRILEQQKPCQVYDTCDYAVTVFGGWNDVTMQYSNGDSLDMFYDMLRSNGFGKENIKIFYGGPDHDSYLRQRYGSMLASSGKSALRKHITSLCETKFCVDSFVIYLNGPTTADGSILLWDNNRNGKADSSEIYSVKEFSDDIANCSARHVFVFADQSHSGVLTSSLLRRSGNSTASIERSPWKNVVVLASGDETDYSWYSDATKHWGSLQPNQTVSEAYQKIGPWYSKPTEFNPGYSQDYTIYGAPFHNELVEDPENYMGCQSLPYPQWTFLFS